MRAWNGTRLANQQLQTGMARLSPGNRINNASDGDAGLAISNSAIADATGNAFTAAANSVDNATH